MIKPCKHCNMGVAGCKKNNFKVICPTCRKKSMKNYLRKWQKENRKKIQSYCKKYQRSHPDVIKAQIKIHKQNLDTHPEKKMFYAARGRAKKRDLECTIILSDIVIPKTCPVLGIPIITDGVLNANSPSIDRHDPEIGYTPENISVVSFRANTLKSDATLQEIKKLLDYLERRKYG